VCCNHIICKYYGVGYVTTREYKGICLYVVEIFLYKRILKVLYERFRNRARQKSLLVHDFNEHSVALLL
jgi:hypothetical protein